MPNWFNGPGITHEEVQAGKIMDFITSNGPPPVKAKEVLELAKQLKAEGKTSVGVYGRAFLDAFVSLSQDGQRNQQCADRTSLTHSVLGRQGHLPRWISRRLASVRRGVPSPRHGGP